MNKAGLHHLNSCWILTSWIHDLLGVPGLLSNETSSKIAAKIDHILLSALGDYAFAQT